MKNITRDYWHYLYLLPTSVHSAAKLDADTTKLVTLIPHKLNFWHNPQFICNIFAVI